MQSLKITCKLINGIITQDYCIPLDSILAAQYIKLERPDLFYSNTPIIDIDIPLQRNRTDHLWYYSCSFCQADWIEHSEQYIHKRNTIYENTKYIGKGRIELGRGKTKSHRIPVSLSHTEVLTWYAVGDKKWISEMLLSVNSIGKKRNLGFGNVIDWDITETDNDYSIIKGNHLMKAVPISDIPSNIEYQSTIYGIRPPYWLPENQHIVGFPYEASNILSNAE